MIIYLFPKIIPVGAIVVLLHTTMRSEAEYDISYSVDMRHDGGYCPIRIFKWVDVVGMHSHRRALDSENFGTIEKILLPQKKQSPLDMT